MEDCLMMIFTAMSGIGAVVAVIVAVIIYQRQKKIALFDRRTQILNDFERFVFSVLPNWEWDGSMTLVAKYSEKEIEALFDESIVKLQKDIINAAKSCNSLIGDIDYAKRKGVCHDKTEFELENEKIVIEKRISKLFTDYRASAYKKWLKI